MSETTLFRRANDNDPQIKVVSRTNPVPIEGNANLINGIKYKLFYFENYEPCIYMLISQNIINFFGEKENKIYYVCEKERKI